MRRYGFRFLAAILTFSIGVALSLVFGLFRVSDTSFQQREWSRPSCPKRTRIVQMSVYKVDNAPTTPLQLVYLGNNDSTTDQLQLGVENRSDKTVAGYVISAGQRWDTESAQKFFDWSSFDVLRPGEMRVITAPREAYGLSLRVAKVDFQDGSVWINPRETR